jgi:tetraacyldisaccharide 4'-kinase
MAHHVTWFREQLLSPRWSARLLRCLLRLASLPYGWIVRHRNAAYDSGRRRIERIEIPVVSVGNLTVGGTGKTPLVAWLAGWLAERGRRVVLVSRGYGSKVGSPNDEAKELADKLPQIPHLQNRDRFAAGRLAIEQFQAEILVLDDAFQHRRLHRDLDIVLLDALDPFGGDHLLPRGLLREPLAGLARARFVVLTRADLVDSATRNTIHQRVTSLAPTARWLEAGLTTGPLLRRGHDPLADQTLRGARVVAFCGLGNPRGFRRTLAAAGAEIVEFREFPDHHAYGPQDLAELEQRVVELSSNSHPIHFVVCTHKDWVKIDRDSLAGCPLVALTISIAWLSDVTPLEDALAALIR